MPSKIFAAVGVTLALLQASAVLAQTPATNTTETAPIASNTTTTEYCRAFEAAVSNCKLRSTLAARQAAPEVPPLAALALVPLMPRSPRQCAKPAPLPRSPSPSYHPPRDSRRHRGRARALFGAQCLNGCTALNTTNTGTFTAYDSYTAVCVCGDGQVPTLSLPLYAWTTRLRNETITSGVVVTRPKRPPGRPTVPVVQTTQPGAGSAVVPAQPAGPAPAAAVQPSAGASGNRAAQGVLAAAAAAGLSIFFPVV
ncbi:uncharacterized protein EV422DRAFT_505878 [Fimicolochytrium jonesii]|uniref:uncharacterized protein n=1 Tax=Fimicolochytrium jonesii TaxID=1396493 RepID=UPI0022FE7F75|nr:uncharacterized protein EV422DRAFT_505878 [Fimicolochytrium jonesii]KAI8821783.1 hypothetical protein EV422DRAFT_505878 [Fimicolochytrium jonesii]